MAFDRPTLLILLLLVLSRSSSAQDGPPNLIKILQDAGHFSNFLRLLKVTHMTGQINTELANTGDGLTVLAPTDAAFSILKPGALSSLSPKDEVELVQFHVITQFLSKTLFLTVSNPLRTLADGTNDGRFPLNITIQGNDLRLSTGIDEAMIGDSLYSANQMAVYEVDRVLLPQTVFPPTAAPAPEKAKDKPTDIAPAADDVSRASRTMGGRAVLCVMILCIAASITCSSS
ncbi:hypothetical protein MLD38_040157 [Melastoma candidum]|uniref:Uncharacterized protein n=1 Tax=Melastoma candidum TaxID=119954 RepID=A0ACB9L5J6_9MYRT|nr:hypothetical protein MLD38_040157 [Melastoma candidum]